MNPITITPAPTAGRRWHRASCSTSPSASRPRTRAADAEGRYRTLVERVPAIAYAWDTAFAPGTAPADYISPQIERLLGVTAQDWLDDPAAWADRVHPHDVERVTAAWDAATALGAPFMQEYRLRTADGTWLWVRDDANPVGPGIREAPVYQGVIIDITEQHAAEEEVRAAEQRWRLLLEHLPIVAYQVSFDPEGQSLRSLGCGRDLPARGGDRARVAGRRRHLGQPHPRRGPSRGARRLGGPEAGPGAVRPPVSPAPSRRRHRLGARPRGDHRARRCTRGRGRPRRHHRATRRGGRARDRRGSVPHAGRAAPRRSPSSRRSRRAPTSTSAHRSRPSTATPPRNGWRTRRCGSSACIPRIATG